MNTGAGLRPHGCEIIQVMQPTRNVTNGQLPSAQVFIAHDRVPGRLRLRVPAIKVRAAKGPLVERALAARPGVRAVRVNPITGSLLIQFDPASASPADIQTWTERALVRADSERDARKGKGTSRTQRVPSSADQPLASAAPDASAPF